MNIAKPKEHDVSRNIVTMKITDIEFETYRPKLSSPKDIEKFIKKVVQVVRGSIEYREYIRYLKQEVDMTRCSFFPNIDTGDGRKRKIKLEVHHEPFTLFDIAQVVTSKYIEEELPITHLVVAEDVMRLHYEGRVGLIPLIKTVHQLAHRGEVVIPLQKVYGDFVSFMKEYAPYISQDLNDMLKSKLEQSREIEQDYSVLEKKYTYLDVEGMALPVPIEK